MAVLVSLRTLARFLMTWMVGVAALAPAAAQPDARRLVREAIEAQGGEAQLRAIRIVQWKARGHRNLLEQSERPEGPYIPDYQTILEIHDHQNAGFRRDIDAAVYPAYQFQSTTVASRDAVIRLIGDRAAPGDSTQLAIIRETLALSPERLLLTALGAPDLRIEPGQTLQAVPHDVLAFSFDDAPVRIYLNRYTHLPTAVDYSGPWAREGGWRFRGDVTMRTYYSFWWRGDNGVRLPMQRNVERNGLPDSSLNIVSLTINQQPSRDMGISQEMHAKFAASPPLPADPPLGQGVDAAPGIVVIPGAWYVMLVRQEDGVVVIEAPISSAYSEKVLAEAQRRFPGVPVKALVSTSDSWPHLAGVRTYVARGIPIYGLDLNMAALKRLSTNGSRRNPMRWSSGGATPIFDRFRTRP